MVQCILIQAHGNTIILLQEAVMVFDHNYPKYCEEDFGLVV